MEIFATISIFVVYKCLGCTSANVKTACVLWYFMACNEVLTPPLPPPPSPVLKHFTPLLQLEMAASAFLLMAASDKHIFTFLKLLQLIKCCHNLLLKKLKQCIKETRFYHHTFKFFMCDDLSFVNTTQKNF